MTLNENEMVLDERTESDKPSQNIRLVRWQCRCNLSENARDGGVHRNTLQLVLGKEQIGAKRKGLQAEILVAVALDLQARKGDAHGKLAWHC